MKLTKADKGIIGFVLLVALAGIIASLTYAPVQGAKTAEIYVAGSLVKRITLREGYRQEFRLGDHEHYNIIEVEDGKVRIREADCPDKECVKMGWIDRPPRQIVCLPNQVVVTVASAPSDDIDDIAR